MKPSIAELATALSLACIAPAALGQASAAFDATLAQSLGADEYGMKHYTLVVLRSGPTRMPAGPDRDAMFAGHFANIKRLADEKKLALAGPFEGSGGDWRGLFVFATPDVDVAKTWVATDPVIINGEMIAEYHPFYATAALMLVVPNHEKVQKKSF